MFLPVHVPGSTNKIQIPLLSSGQSGKNAHFFHRGELEVLKCCYYKFDVPPHTPCPSSVEVVLVGKYDLST